MPWWAWMVAGFGLMALELAGVEAAFYIVFLGAAAVVVGVAEAAGAGLPIWGQWVLYAVLTVAFMVLFRRKLYERVRGSAPGFDNSTVGETVDVTEECAAGRQDSSRHARQPLAGDECGHRRHRGGHQGAGGGCEGHNRRHRVGLDVGRDRPHGSPVLGL